MPWSRQTPGGKDTIVFDKRVFTEGYLLTLTSGEISISDDLTIKGLGAEFVCVSGNDSSRIFKIDDGNAKVLRVALSGLTLQEGYAGNEVGGGAIFSAETLSISDSVLTGKSRSICFHTTPGTACSPASRTAPISEAAARTATSFMTETTGPAEKSVSFVATSTTA